MELTPFEHQPVYSAGIEIRNAAGGLREALAIDPEEIHVGETRHIVLEVTCTRVRFDPIKDVDGLNRVHIFDASSAAFVDGTSWKQALAKTQQRIADAKEIEGQQSLVDDADAGLDDEPDELLEDEWDDLAGDE